MSDLNERILQKLRQENPEAVAELAIHAIRLSESNNIDSVVDQLKAYARALLKEGKVSNT